MCTLLEIRIGFQRYAIDVSFTLPIAYKIKLDRIGNTKGILKLNSIGDVPVTSIA